MKLGLILIFLSLTSINLANAHGENKFGPHGGYIRMPGAFHTELVPSHEDSFSIYLMDVNNKNPIVKDSSVKLAYINQSKRSEFKCFPVDDHFTCKPSKKINSTQGKLIINAVRLKIKSNDAIYDLPLRLIAGEKSENKKHDMNKM